MIMARVQRQHSLLRGLETGKLCFEDRGCSSVIECSLSTAALMSWAATQRAEPTSRAVAAGPPLPSIGSHTFEP